MADRPDREERVAAGQFDRIGVVRQHDAAAVRDEIDQDRVLGVWQLDPPGSGHPDVRLEDAGQPDRAQQLDERLSGPVRVRIFDQRSGMIGE